MNSSANDFLKILEKTKKILIVTPPQPTDDAICCSFSLCHWLSKRKKEATLLQTSPFPQHLNFLPAPSKIINTLTGSRDFVLIFNTKHNRIIDLKTVQTPNEYIIRITPENESIDPKDFSFIPADFKYDLIITVNSAELESLGPIYQQNTDLFFEIPKVNLDCQSNNENFGQINMVDITASSVSEILAEFILGNQETEMDQAIAQTLLTGIISATESFQKPTTTPQSMIISARLMKYKADQPTIIRHLYKTKSLSFLKLWGRVMARLSWDEETKLIWSLLSIEDFAKSRADKEDIPFILQQIQENFSQGQIFAIFYGDTPTKTFVQLGFTNEKKAREIAALFDLNYSAKRLIIPFENKNLLEAEKDFLEKLEIKR